MITAGRVRATRALLGLDQRLWPNVFASPCPTIERVEATDGGIRSNVDSQMKLANALAASGIERIGDNAPSITGGRDMFFVS
jgi:hypothetical protein